MRGLLRLLNLNLLETFGARARPHPLRVSGEESPSVSLRDTKNHRSQSTNDFMALLLRGRAVSRSASRPRPWALRAPFTAVNLDILCFV